MRALLALAAALAVPAGAPAATLTAQPRDAYGAATVSIAQGEGLRFTNDDLDRHDVTSDADGLFHSALAGTGETVEVPGIAALAPGRYGFHCSLHPFMTAALEVAGLQVRVSTATLAAARHGVGVAIAQWPAARATVSGRLTIGARAFELGPRTAPGAGSVRLALPSGARRSLRRARRVVVSVSVVAGGRKAAATRTLR